jgi:hypothetical protein
MRHLALSTLIVICACGRVAGDDGGDDGSGSSAATSTTTENETVTSAGSEDSESDASETDGCDGECKTDLGVVDCDPGLQDCPEGFKCTAYVETPGYCCVDANKCVPIIGDKQLGEACTRGEDNDDCAEGLFCMTEASGDTGDGVCLAFCDVNDPGACDSIPACEAACMAFNDGVLPLCEEECDPLRAPCDGPQGCYAVGNEGWVCTLPGGDQYDDGEQCYTIQSCKNELSCASGSVLNGCDHDACCTPLCDLDEGAVDNPRCPDPQEQCLPYFEDNMAPECHAHLGVCALP